MASDNKIMYILAYVFTWVSGLIVFFISKDDPKAKFHGMQAILLGVVAVVLWFVLIGFILSPLIWLYGLYIGYVEYSQGKTMKVPVLGDWAEKFASGK